jgi:hypothetical protein
MTVFVLVHGAWHRGWWQRSAWRKTCGLVNLAATRFSSPLFKLFSRIAARSLFECHEVACGHEVTADEPQQLHSIVVAPGPAVPRQELVKVYLAVNGSV